MKNNNELTRLLRIARMDPCHGFSSGRQIMTRNSAVKLLSQRPVPIMLRQMTDEELDIISKKLSIISKVTGKIPEIRRSNEKQNRK
jgi:hypothetical protein